MSIRLLVYMLLLQLFMCASLAERSFASDESYLADARDVLKYRALHLVLRGNSIDVAKAMVDHAKASGFNAIVFLITDGVAMDKAPWISKPNAWSKARLVEWVDYIRSRGMEPIPEIKLLTHQEKFLAAKHPELLFNAVTYDPRNEAVYRIVFSFLDEIISTIRPNIIHIGHDEVAEWNKAYSRKKIRAGERALPSDLYLEDVLKLYTFLRQKNIQVWMWGDMLLSPEEFPGMFARHLHGTLPGYGKALRDRLPRDIVICDWHYYDTQQEFQSLSRMQAEGFRVIAVTWKQANTIRNFANYARLHNAYGLMATTWHNFDSPQHRPLVEWIITVSGQLFRSAPTHNQSSP